MTRNVTCMNMGIPKILPILRDALIMPC
jgi:hypothetical protein